MEGDSPFLANRHAFNHSAQKVNGLGEFARENAKRSAGEKGACSGNAVDHADNRVILGQRNHLPAWV